MNYDEFSDDGFDELPDNALQELENHAIQSTQANLLQRQRPSQAPRKPHYTSYDWEDDDDLDTAEVTNDAGVAIGRPVVDKTLRQPTQPLQAQHRGPLPARPRPPMPNPRWNPTINPAEAPRSPLVARPRIQDTGPHSQSFTTSQNLSGHAQGLASQSSQFAQQNLSHNQILKIRSALERRVRTLEVELSTSQGEALTLRSNLQRLQQERDAEVSLLKQANADSAAMYERVAKEAVAAEKTARTELQFLQRDMKEVSDRSRRKDAAVPTRAGSATPKKATKTWGMADGFDDMDIASSPTKVHGRGKNANGSVAFNVGERTPSKGKRKRPMLDSPVRALETHPGDVDMMQDQVALPPASHLHGSSVSAAPFDFLQLVLGHGFARGQPPTFEYLSRFSFPSDPEGKAMSTLIFEKLPLMGKSHLPMQLLVDFAQQMIVLWTRCYQEQYWEPIKYLASLVSFTFHLHTSSVAPLVCHELVPTAQATLLLAAEGLQRLPDGTVPSADEYHQLQQHIDTTQILSLLYTTAVACATTPLEAEDGSRYSGARFWRFVSPDVIRMLLAPKQRAADIIGTLELLGTSSLPDSIGPVVDDADAGTTAAGVIDRVSAKLTEHSRAPNTPEQKRGIRLAALKALVAFARHAFGAQQLASHKDALPRLVICLSNSIDDLYDQSVPSSILPPLPDSLKYASSFKLHESTASADLHRIISQCLLLIHLLVTDPLTAEAADIQGKLSVYHGGSQRYLIALGRLAFAEEDLVMEAGIEGEIVEAAHELLEMAVTPAEGETVSEAFGA